jgi:hypothetical protein
MSNAPSVAATVLPLEGKWTDIATKYAEHNGLVYLCMKKGEGKDWRICTKGHFAKLQADDSLTLKHVLSTTQPVKTVPFMQVTPVKKVEIKEEVINNAVEAALKMEAEV